MKFPEELKEAISQLPSKEKEKLIFRLLKHDLDLANRLLFELVSTDTVTQRRETIRKKLEIAVKRATEQFDSPGYLNMDVRYMSGVVARAFKIMLLIRKQHEDYFIEFEEGLKKFGNLIGQNPHLLNAAMHNGLDVNWLVKAEIHKDLRKRGYLK